MSIIQIDLNTATETLNNLPENSIVQFPEGSDVDGYKRFLATGHAWYLQHVFGDVYILKTDYLGYIDLLKFDGAVLYFQPNTTTEVKQQVYAYLRAKGCRLLLHIIDNTTREETVTYFSSKIVCHFTQVLGEQRFKITPLFANLANLQYDIEISETDLMNIVAIGSFEYDTNRFIVVDPKFKNILETTNDIINIRNINTKNVFVKHAEKKLPITEKFAFFLNNYGNYQLSMKTYKPFMFVDKNEVMSILNAYISKYDLRDETCVHLDGPLADLFGIANQTIIPKTFDDLVAKNMLFETPTKMENILAEFIYRLHKSDEALPPIIIWYRPDAEEKSINWPLVFRSAESKGRFSDNNVNFDKDVCILFKQTNVLPILRYTDKDFTTIKSDANCPHFIDKMLNDIVKTMI